MSDRPFRTKKSLDAETLTRGMLPRFLTERGFTNVKNFTERNGQTIVATSPSGESLTMRVRTCWVREIGTRDVPRVRTYSAAQITGKVKNNNWEETIRDKADRDKAKGTTHFLFVQREDEQIIYAALVPASELVTIWTKQKDEYDNLLSKKALGRKKQNPSRNGSSPTLYLQSDKAPTVGKILWEHPGVEDLAKLTIVVATRLPDDEANQEGKYIPEEGDRRKAIERTIRERRGQQAFRNLLRARFGDRCLVTGCEVLAVLEAAHINPYRGESDNHGENGLLLRSDIHTLYDLNLLGIVPETLSVELHPSLLAEYGHLVGVILNCPSDKKPCLTELQKRYLEYKDMHSHSLQVAALPPVQEPVPPRGTSIAVDHS